MYVLLRLWTIGNSACAAFGNGIRADLDQAASFMHVVRYRPEPAAGLVSSTSNSGDGSEQADGLDVIGQAPVSVYSQQVDDLAPGDTLEAISEVQVETTDHRAAVHSTLVLADSPSDTSGTPLQADNLTEVNPYMGKLPIHDSTSWTVPGGISGSRFLNLVMRGEHLQTLGTAPDDEIAIAPDAGRLLVQHLRPVDNEPPDTSHETAGRRDSTGPTRPELELSLFTSSEQKAPAFSACSLARTSSPGGLGSSPCDPPRHATASLADGPHGFEVRARDRAGNPSIPRRSAARLHCGHDAAADDHRQRPERQDEEAHRELRPSARTRPARASSAASTAPRLRPVRLAVAADQAAARTARPARSGDRRRREQRALPARRSWRVVKRK